MVQPVVGVGGGAALDRDERVAHPHRQRAWTTATDREASLGARHRADRRHHRRGAARERLDQPSACRFGAPLVDRVALFAHLDALRACKRQDRVAGDAGQDRAGQRGRRHAAVVEHEEDVHAAQFLDPAALGRVEEDHLVAAVADRLGLREQAGRIVAAALGGAGAALRGAGVLLADPDRHGRRAALEIRADRRGEHHVEIFRRRLHAEKHFGREHERAQVQRTAVAVGDPVGVGLHQPLDRFDEQVFGKFGHRQTPRRILEAARVSLGTEQRGAAVGESIRLHPLEDLLRVMQHRRRRIDRQRRARGDPRVVPALGVAIADHRHVIGEDAPESGIDQPLCPLVRLDRCRVRFMPKGGRRRKSWSGHRKSLSWRVADDYGRCLNRSTCLPQRLLLHPCSFGNPNSAAAWSCCTSAIAT